MVELAIGIGLVLNLVSRTLLGYVAGGMVVPGYLALHLHEPLRVASTIAVSLVTFLILKALSQFMLLYGMRHQTLAIIIGYLLTTGIRYGFGVEAVAEWESLSVLQAIGVIVPGLIAHWMDRQGVLETVSSLILCAVITRFLLILLMGGLAVAG